MTVIKPSSGIVARNFETSFLFPENAADKVLAFLASTLGGYQRRSYMIEDSYAEIADEAKKRFLARHRTERSNGTETANIIVACDSHKYLIVPAVPAPDPAFDPPIIALSKQRDEWTRRFGARLGGRHYGSFLRVSVDRSETAWKPDVPPRRTFPDHDVAEFEYAGSGKQECLRLIEAFVAFCERSAIRLQHRQRGIAGRLETLLRPS